MQWYVGKKAFITGGSSGIGLATAKLLAKYGASVAIAARGKQRLDEALAEIKAAGAGHNATYLAFPLDVSDRTAVDQVCQQVISQLGGLDILINSAGVAHPGYIQNTPDDVFESMMRINYFGTVYSTRAVLPLFTAQRNGHIANVSSLLGYMGIFGYTAYAASKFAVCGFSDALRQELLPHNVGVSILFPPDTDTPQLHEENKIKPLETKAIAGNVKVLSAESVANELLQGIATNRYHILPGTDNKVTYFLYRHFPWLVRWKIDGDLKRCQQKKQGGKSDPAISAT